MTDIQAMAAELAALNARMNELGPALQAIAERAHNAFAYSQAGYNLQIQLADAAERSLFLQGQMAARGLPDRLRTLSDAEFRVSSQWGEDGIIDWLVQRVAVPDARFIEFGVETFREANCRFLMQHRNWRGLVIDGNTEQIQALRNDKIFWMHDLTALGAFITAENINDLFRQAGFTGPIGLLSVDIDGADYWVLNAIDCIEPAIVVCEYNALLGCTMAFPSPRCARGRRARASPSSGRTATAATPSSFARRWRARSSSGSSRWSRGPTSGATAATPRVSSPSRAGFSATS
jgi:hypothetical protein